MDESKENRKIETKELVRQYLKRKYPDAQFSDIDLDFLVRYSVKKEPSANTILKSIGNDIQTEQAYYNAHPAVKAAKDDLQYIYGRFSQKQKDYKNAFNGNFEAFLAWWCEKTPENGIRHCCYCGIDENTLKDAFKNGLVISKKLHRRTHFHLTFIHKLLKLRNKVGKADISVYLCLTVTDFFSKFFSILQLFTLWGKS